MAREKDPGSEGADGAALVPRDKSADPKIDALAELIDRPITDGTAAKQIVPLAKPAPIEPAEPESLGFALRLESGKALLELKNKAIGSGVTVGRLEMEIPKVKFPFDVSGGAERFHSTRCVLRSLVLHLSHDALKQELQKPGLKEAGFFDLEALPENGAMTVTGSYADGATTVPFSFAMAPVIMAPRELGLLPFDERVFGACKLPAPRVPWLLLQAMGGLPLKANQPVFDVVAMSVRELLPRYGWKIPDTSEVGLIQAEVSKNGWIIACGRTLLDQAKSETRVSFAVEARAPFEDIEAVLYTGDDKKAFAAYRKHVDEEVPHRFAIRRYLQLAAADERRHEEGRSVAEEALLKDEDNIDALLFLGHYAELEGDHESAAKRYTQAATALWNDKSDRAAALADVTAATIAKGFDQEAARKSLARTLKKRKSDVRALQQSFALESVAKNVKGATSSGERLLRAMPEEERFQVHLQLGQMLLEHDLKKAKLHAERALRARMDDPDAIRLVARLFAKSGDVPRAVRYLSRLSERFIALGDMTVATAIEMEIAEQLERTEHEPSFDPRALLGRYQRVLTLDPTSKQAMLRAAQLAYAIGELETAKRWYEELESEADAALKAEASFRLGEIAMSEKRDEDAEASFEAALGGPFAKQAYGALRKIYETRGDVRALFDLEKQLGANTDDLASQLEHHMRAADLAARQQMTEAELSHLEAALALAPSDAIVKRRMLEAVLQHQGQAQVEALLTKWAPREHEPTTRSEWYLELANLRENKNDLTGAKEALDQAIKADPMSAEANEALYVLCQKLNEPYGAFAALGNLARYRHASDEAKAEIRITQAELLAGPLGRRDEARAYLLRALIDVPHHVRGLKLLGELAEEQNDSAMAEDAWRRFLETGAEEGRVHALSSLARLARQRGDLQDQFNHLFELWQIDQKAETFDQLRAVLKERGDFQRLVLLLRDASATATGEKANEYRWQTALVLRDSVGDWASAREELLPLADSPGQFGDLARQALVGLAEDEGRPELLAQALEKQLMYSPGEDKAALKLQIARAYRESGDHEAAQAAYTWVLEQDPKQDEALGYLAERAESTGNAELAFTLQLSRFAAGFDDAMPALSRVADTVPSTILIKNITKLDKLPGQFALDVAGRLDAEGYSEEAVQAIERALSHAHGEEARFPLALAIARIQEASLRKPALAIETLKKEQDHAPDFLPLQQAVETMVERAGSPRQRAELVLSRAIASGAVTQMWTAFEALVEAAPDHDRLGSIFAEIALHPALRARVIDFLLRDDAARVVGEKVRANVLLSIHDSEALPEPALRVLAKLVRAEGDRDAAERLYAELIRRAPEDEALFAEWQAGADEKARSAAETTRFEAQRTKLKERGEHRALAELLLAGIAARRVGQETLLEVRDLLERAGDPKAALKVAETVTRAFPAELANWIRRGELALAADEPAAVTAALEDLSQALATTEGLDPSELSVLEKRFAHALLAAGHEQQARVLLETILARDPQDDEIYGALKQALKETPALLLPWARARRDAVEGKAQIAATREYLQLAVAAPDDGAALGALALLAEQDAIQAQDVVTGFLLVTRRPERLSEVWDWAEQLTLGLDVEGKREIAAICQKIGDEAADEIRASLVGAIPPAQQLDAETLYLARRLDRTGHADLALTLLRQLPFARVLASPELSSLWLDVATTTKDLKAKIALLAARAKAEGAPITARIDYAEALVDANDERSAFGELQALITLPELDQDPRADALRKTHRHLLYAHARERLAQDPNAALALANRLLAEAPDSEEAWLLTVDAARLSKDDDKLVSLLQGRALSAELFAELAGAYERTQRPKEAAYALLEAFALKQKAEWSGRALTLLEKAGDKERLAAELVRHAAGHANARAMLDRALALFTEIGDVTRAAELSARLFESNPEDDTAFERQRTILLESADAGALARALEKRLQVAQAQQKHALAIELARLYIEKLFTHDDAEKVLTRELGGEAAAQAALYDIYDGLGDTQRAATLAKRMFQAAPTDDAAYARHKKHIEAGASTIDLFELLEARTDALPIEAREAVATEAAIVALERLHDADAAEHVLKKAFADERTFVMRALALYDRAGDDERAAACVKRAFELDPTDEELYQRHRLWLEQKSDVKALVTALELRAGVFEEPRRSQVALEAARAALDRAKDPERAGLLLVRFFGETPSDPQVLQLRIAICLRTGNDVEAMALLKGLAAATEQVNEKASLLLQAAGIAERLGVAQEAATLWGLAFSAAPSRDEAAKRPRYLAALDADLRAKVLHAALAFIDGAEKTEAELALCDYHEGKGELAEALALAKGILARDPESASLRARVGALYEKLGNTESHVQLLAEQHATSLDRAERYKLAVQIAEKAERDLNDLEQAVHFYRQATKDDPSAPAPFTELVRLYGLRNAGAERCDAMESLIQLTVPSKERGELCMRLGEWRSERGELDKAALAYLHAFAEAVSTPAARRSVKLVTKRGLYIDEAVRALRHVAEASEQAQERIDALRDAAEIVADSKADYAQAAALFREALAQGPKTRDDRVRLIEWLERAGQLQAALDELFALIDAEEREDSKNLLMKRAQALVDRSGDPSMRVALTRRLIETGKLGADDQLSALGALIDAGHTNDARDLALRMFDAAKTPEERGRIERALSERKQVDLLVEGLLSRAAPEKRGQAMCEAATILENADEADRAYALYREALTDKLDLDEKVLVHIADLAERRGDDPLLSAVYLRIAESDAGTETRARAYFAMAKLWLEKTKDLVRADDCLEACLKLQPDHKDARRLRARLLIETGRSEEAKAYLDDLATLGAGEDPTWIVNAAKALIGAGDLTKARSLLTPLIAGSDDAFWALFDLEAKAENHPAVVRMLLDRIDSGGPVDSLDRYRAGAFHAAAANIRAAEERFLAALHSDGVTDPAVYARLAALTLARSDLESAHLWTTAQATHAANDQERALALQAAGELARTLGKQEEAQRQLEAAFNLNPQSIAVLDQLFELYRTGGDAERLLMVGERLVIVEPQKKRAQSFYLTLAEAAERTRTDAARVMEFYQLAASTEALPVDAIERAIAAAEAAGKHVERLEWEEERLAHVQAHADDYVRLGVIARDRLNDPGRAERYFRLAKSTDPAAVAPINALAAILAPQKGKTQEAIALYKELQQRTPTDPEPYRLLARLYGQEQDVDRTFLFYDVLRALDPADEEAERFVTAAHRVLTELPPRGLGKNELGQIADAGLLTPLQQFFGPVAAQAEMLYATDIARMGLGEQDLVQLDQGFGRRLALLMQRMGGRALEVLSYRAKVGGRDAIIEPGAPARLIVSQDTPDMPPRATHFVVCRALAFLALGHLLPSRLPTADLATLLGLLCKRFVPSLPVPGVPEDRASFVIERFRAVTPEDTWAGHAQVAASFAAHNYASPALHADIDAWVKSGERTADRWALLMCGDLAQAFSATKQVGHVRTTALPARGPQRIAAIQARPDLMDLISFAVSDTYASVRQALGLTLKR
ncbi:MAG: hypothetical protein IT381_31260 [Deltaproteobacteria bacterium]|nr:hypothetical protein [Deltaproteobacteria bacterium]